MELVAWCKDSLAQPYSASKLISLYCESISYHSSIKYTIPVIQNVSIHADVLKLEKYLVLASRAEKVKPGTEKKPLRYITSVSGNRCHTMLRYAVLYSKLVCPPK